MKEDFKCVDMSNFLTVYEEECKLQEICLQNDRHYMKYDTYIGIVIN